MMKKTGEAIEILKLISRDARSAWEVLRIDEALNDAAKRLKGVEHKDTPYAEKDSNPCTGKEETWFDVATGKEEKIWVLSSDSHENKIDDYPLEPPESTPEEIADELEQTLLWHLNGAVEDTDEALAALDFCLFPSFDSVEDYYNYLQPVYVGKEVINKVTRKYPCITETELRLEYMALSSNPTMQKEVAQMVEDAMKFPNIEKYRDLVSNDENYDTYYTWPCLEFLNGWSFYDGLGGDVYKLQTMVRGFDLACEKLRNIYKPDREKDELARQFIDKYERYIPQAQNFIVKLKTMNGRDVSLAHKQHLQISNISLKEFCGDCFKLTPERRSERGWNYEAIKKR